MSMAVGEDRRRRGDGARGRHRAARLERFVTNPARRASRQAASLRLLVFVALAAFLLYYVGPRNIAETSLKVALAVALTVAVWVGANLLFDQAYDHWTRFNTIVGAVLGFVGFFIAESNGSLKTLVDQPVRPVGSGRVRHDHRMEHAAVRRQLAAVGTDRRCRPRIGDVPAQRTAAAARPASPGGARVHRLRAAHCLCSRRFGVAGARLGQAPRSVPPAAQSCSG